MLTPHDLMTLDAIRLHFATQGKTYWAGTVQRALEALQQPDSRAAVPAITTAGTLPSDPGGAYIGLARGKTPANEAASVDGKPASNSAGLPSARTFHIEDDRARGKLAAQALVLPGSDFGVREG